MKKERKKKPKTDKHYPKNPNERKEVFWKGRGETLDI